MSVSTDELITHASHLALDAQSTEVCLRTSVSRAYYAAYHDCQHWHSFLQTPGSVGSQLAAGIHSTLIAQLAHPDSKLPLKISINSRKRAYALRALRDKRTHADYDLDSTLTKEEAIQAIADAKIILAVI